MTEQKFMTGIDHPVIAVRDMQSAYTDYARLGFAIPPRGSHLEWGTGNWCIMFEENYLELRGIIDPTKYTHQLDKFLEIREGLMGVALGTDDAQASHDTLIARKLHPQPVRQLTRNFELPQGTVQPRFALCFQDMSETSALMSVVLCQHLTPELLRRPEWLRHKNGAVAVAAMTGVVADVDDAAKMLERLFGQESIVRANDRLTIHVGQNQEILLMSIAEATDAFAGFDVPIHTDSGHLCSVVLRVHNLDATREFFASQDIGYKLMPSGTIRTFPHDACGVLLEFKEQRGLN